MLEVPGVTFYSLQLGEAADELGEFGAGITDLSPMMADWIQTAAVIYQLDLVISVDTSVAHLAGA